MGAYAGAGVGAVGFPAARLRAGWPRVPGEAPRDCAPPAGMRDGVHQPFHVCELVARPQRGHSAEDELYDGHGAFVQVGFGNAVHPEPFPTMASRAMPRSLWLPLGPASSAALPNPRRRVPHRADAVHQLLGGQPLVKEHVGEFQHHRVVHRRFGQIPHAAEMVVVGVAIHAGALHDVAHGDLLEGRLAQAFPKRVFHAFDGVRPLGIFRRSSQAGPLSAPNKAAPLKGACNRSVLPVRERRPVRFAVAPHAEGAPFAILPAHHSMSSTFRGPDCPPLRLAACCG